MKFAIFETGNSIFLWCTESLGLRQNKLDTEIILNEEIYEKNEIKSREEIRKFENELNWKEITNKETELSVVKTMLVHQQEDNDSWSLLIKKKVEEMAKVKTEIKEMKGLLDYYDNEIDKVKRKYNTLWQNIELEKYQLQDVESKAQNNCYTLLSNYNSIVDRYTYREEESVMNNANLKGSKNPYKVNRISNFTAKKKNKKSTTTMSSIKNSGWSKKWIIF